MEFETELPKDIYTSNALVSSIETYKDYLSASVFPHDDKYLLKIKTDKNDMSVDVEIIQSFMTYVLNESIHEMFNE